MDSKWQVECDPNLLMPQLSLSAPKPKCVCMSVCQSINLVVSPHQSDARVVVINMGEGEKGGIIALESSLSGSLKNNQHQKTKKKKEKKIKHTCCEEHNGFHAVVFCAVHMKSFEFLHLFLEDSNMIHVGNYPIGCHGICMSLKP